MRNKSVLKNAVLNVIRNISNIIYPLITFPYVSRVLGVEGVGRYNFANSVISYFILIAGLGINSYAIREGSRLREDRSKFSAFASEVFTINVISTIISYICLFICIATVKKLDNYRLLIIVFSIQIVAATIGVEWIYSVYEEYSYITIRTIAFKLLSLILLFWFVREEADVVNYALVTVFALSGSGILNLIHSQHYCKLHMVPLKNVRRHLKAIFILFSSSVAVMIYVYSDITILGFLKSDFEVGLYSLSSKVYTIMKSLISALLVVSIPSLSALYGKKDMEKYNNVLQNIVNLVTLLLLPCVVGVFLLSENIVVLVGGADYKRASGSLQILSIALLFCLYGWIYNQCVLLPTKNEKIISLATISSAVLNIVLNFALIPIWSEKAAAFTTLVSELLMLIVCWKNGKRLINASVFNDCFKQVVIGCTAIIIVCFFCRYLIKQNIICTIVSIIVSALVYSVVLILLKNTQIKLLLRKILKRKEDN